MVREEGFEPSRPRGLGILSPVRLPFRHSRIQANANRHRLTTGGIMHIYSQLVKTKLAIAVAILKLLSPRAAALFIATGKALSQLNMRKL